MSKHELPAKLLKKITALCEDGDRLGKARDDAAAVDKYHDAWDLIPEPKENWEASTWVLASMGEVYYRNQRYEKALHSFQSAVMCPNGLGNPYIHLRLGQIQFELGDRGAAADELTRAYMGAGEEIFRAEDQKFYQFLQTVMLPPSK